MRVGRGVAPFRRAGNDPGFVAADLLLTYQAVVE